MYKCYFCNSKMLSYRSQYLLYRIGYIEEYSFCVECFEENEIKFIHHNTNKTDICSICVNIFSEKAFVLACLMKYKLFSVYYDICPECYHKNIDLPFTKKVY